MRGGVEMVDKVDERKNWGREGGPFWRRGLSPSQTLPLSPKTFGLIESLFPVFRKVKAGGADRVRKNILRANQF